MKKKSIYRKQIYGAYAECLRKCLQRADLSQKQLSFAIQRSQASVSDYCNGLALPSLEIQEKILEFLKRPDLCRILQEKYFYFTSVAQVMESVRENADNSIDAANELATRGLVRQAVLLLQRDLDSSVEPEFRSAVQDALFELYLMCADYGECLKLAKLIALDETISESLRTYRSSAMQGIVFRSGVHQNLEKALAQFKLARTIRSHYPEEIPKQDQIMAELWELLGTAQEIWSSNPTQLQRILKSLEERDLFEMPSALRANLFEITARCHVLSGNFDRALHLLNQIDENELSSVRMLEERRKLTEASIYQKTGQFEAARRCLEEAAEICRLNGNVHHLVQAQKLIVAL